MYKSLLKPRVRSIVKPNNIDNAINYYINPIGVTNNKKNNYKG
jgi:hypothetical protein